MGLFNKTKEEILTKFDGLESKHEQLYGFRPEAKEILAVIEETLEEKRHHFLKQAIFDETPATLRTMKSEIMKKIDEKPAKKAKE